MMKHVQIRESWVWDGTIEAFIKYKIKGTCLNVCAGKSPLGDIKIDLDPQDNSVIRGDMIKLPFDDCTFDTVIQDPPWKIGFYHRMKPFFECVRVTKLNGRIIYNAYWIPSSKATELEEVHIRQDKPFTNTSIISIHKKVSIEYD